MEAFVRCIRDGRLADATSSSPAPVALIERSCSQAGGAEVLRQVFSSLCEAIGSGRAQATHVTVVCFTEAPSCYEAAAAAASGCPCTVLDCFSDPWGWNRSFLYNQGRHMGQSSDAAEADNDPRDTFAGPSRVLTNLTGIEADILAAAAATTGPSNSALPRQSLVFIDDLSSLLEAHRFPQVAAMLCRVSEDPSVSACVAGLYTGQPGMAGLVLSANAWLTVGPAPRLHAEAVTSRPGAADAAVDGSLEARIQRKSGRITVEQQVFSLDADGSLRLSAAPQPPTAQQLVEAALSKSATAASKQDADQLAQDLMKNMDGGMKLTLTDQEWDAKGKVVLPYEHRGDSSVYQAEDFTQYLPPAAGGAGAGSGKNKLGHILYVRDSDDEGEYDSDEDPDDDLDI